MEIEKPKRQFIDESLLIDSWEKVEMYVKDLLNREIDTKEKLESWLKDHSELESILEEDEAWRYIKMTIDTKNEALSKSYSFFVTEIQPKLAPYEDQLNRKLMAAPHLKELEKSPAYFIFFRSIRKALDLYREENISLISEIAEESQKYGSVAAAQTIEHDGQRLTMQKASMLLKEPEENIRKIVFQKIKDRRAEDKDTFNKLFDSLLKKRHQIALNAGFENFRDYKMEAMGRFDYSVKDCEDFHHSVKKVIVPIVKLIQEERLKKLGKSKFKPWDLSVDPEGKPPLKPFEKGEELLTGTVRMFEKVDPYFSDCLKTMEKMGHLDLESKEGKAPGGYNYPLYEIGVPFIFMNAVGSQQDLVTMVHEGGHAIHSFLSRDLELTGFKNLPSEVAELASMSMELLSMEYWDEFYSNEEDLKRAKKDQLESILKILPWIAQIDEFQHWLYTNPEHTNVERTEKWMLLNKEYGTGLTDWTGYEEVQETSWHRQLHLFEVPFYYIEYGIAQLGALGIWKNSMENKKKAIDQYKDALRLAYTRTIPEIYKTAGVEFNFSTAHIQELADFVERELSRL